MQDPDKDTTKDGKNEDSQVAEGTLYGGHPIGDAPEVDGDDNLIEDKFEEPIASPSVTGEEDVFLGDMPQGEPADIDQELEKLGLSGDSDKGPKTLGISDDLE